MTFVTFDVNGRYPWGAAFVSQENLEVAVNLIKARKLMEEEIRRPLGFRPAQRR